MQRMLDDEIKGLDAEIDSAIDRLFVDKNLETVGSSWKESGTADSLYKSEVVFPESPELSGDQDFSFPPLLGLADEPKASFSYPPALSKEKDKSLSDPGGSFESEFFLTDSAAPSPEREHPLSEFLDSSEGSELSFSGSEGPSQRDQVSDTRDAQPLQESDFFLSRPAGPSAGKEVSSNRTSGPSQEREDFSFGEFEPPQDREFFFSHPSESSDKKQVSSVPPSGASYEMEITFSPSPLSSSLAESLDTMESQLLSLEWEITKENLRKTREEVVAFRKNLKEKPEVTYVLGLMEKVLDPMVRKEGDIRPAMIKFLIDAKETIKLLLKDEISVEMNSYKQLAYTGIETRFSCLKNEEKNEESYETGGPLIWDRMEGLLTRITTLEEKMEGMLKDWEVQLSQFPNQRTDPKGHSVNVTVFKVDQKLLGVDSDKVFKLFKVPNGHNGRYFNQQKIRLNDLDARIIDLREILSIQRNGANQKAEILMVRDNGGYKGLIVDQVIKKLSGCEEIEQKQGEYFSGAVHWTYQDRAVNIPILDLEKLLI